MEDFINLAPLVSEETIEKLKDALNVFEGQPISPSFKAAATTALDREILRLEASGELPEDYLRLCITDLGAGNLHVLVIRNFKKYPCTAEEAEVLLRGPPIHDDLERINCQKDGHDFHGQCGMCLIHAAPRMCCGCAKVEPAARTLFVSLSKEVHVDQH